ncbi:MAG: HD-GYP domain-containing protein [Candidatus Saccharibacteria bacterium]
MRRISVNSLQPGMVVGRTIFDNDGRALLSAGITLNESQIKHLIETGFTSIYIKNDFASDIDAPPDVISDETRIETIRLVKESFQTLEQRRRLNISSVQATVDKLIDELLMNRSILVNLADIRSHDDYTFSHCVSVCVLAIMTGITMGYSEQRLKEIGIGALLHDIGKVRIDKDILVKPGELTDEEYNEVKCHPEYGFDILRTYDDVPLLSAHIAFQHHERWDGKGYPRRLTAEEIHEYARIVSVADVYDALMADRPYRPAYSVNQAVTIISRMSGTQFDPRVLNALVANIAIFPVGSVVALSTGEIGVVIQVHKDLPAKPVVRVVLDNNLRRMSKPHEVDLAKLKTVYIAKLLEDDEVAELFHGFESILTLES